MNPIFAGTKIQETCFVLIIRNSTGCISVIAPMKLHKEKAVALLIIMGTEAYYWWMILEIINSGFGPESIQSSSIS